MGLYLYSTATAFLIPGGVYYDVVIVVVVGAAVRRAADRETVAGSTAEPPADAAGSVPATHPEAD